MSMPSNVIEPDRRLQQADHRPPCRALAAAGLADEPERLAPGEREADAIDRLHVADVSLEDDARRDREPDLQILDLDERLAEDCPLRNRGRRATDPARRLAGGHRHATTSSVGASSSMTEPGGGAATNPSRSGRPAAASAAVGRLWQATRCVASGPEVWTLTPASSGMRSGLSVQQTGSRHAQRGANGQPTGSRR